MKKTLQIRIANAAGNVTSFVLDRCSRGDYQTIFASAAVIFFVTTL